MHISELANRHVDISIHALHEESDCRIASTIFLRTHFNPRSP